MKSTTKATKQPTPSAEELAKDILDVIASRAGAAAEILESIGKLPPKERAEMKKETGEAFGLINFLLNGKRTVPRSKAARERLILDAKAKASAVR